MKFAYRGYDRAGAAAAGTLEADDAASAREALRARGVFPTTVEPAAGEGARAAAAGHAEHGRHDRARRTLNFAKHAQVLVRAGATLPDALASVERQAKDDSWRAVISDVRQRVERGQSLGEALDRHPGSFDPVVRSLVRAGESTGRLGDMLQRVAKLAQRQVQIRNQITGALVYPIALMGICIAVVAVLLLFVIPRFEGMFKSLQAPVPASTEVILAISAVLRSHSIAVGIAVAALAAGAVVALRHPRGREAVDRFVVLAPGVGKITRRLFAARVARLLGVLLESRVPLLEALEMVRESIPNRTLRAVMERAEAAVADGDPLSASLAESPLVDESLREAVRSGEDAGDMALPLLSVADFLDEENEVMLRSATSMLEPIVLITMGLIVGSIALSMFLPLFDMTGMV